MLENSEILIFRHEHNRDSCFLFSQYVLKDSTPTYYIIKSYCRRNYSFIHFCDLCYYIFPLTKTWNSSWKIRSANKPDQFEFMCKIFFQFYSSLWLNQDNITVFLVTGLQNHKQTETQTTTPPQTKNQAVPSTESHLNCCNSCCLWTAQTSLRNAYLLCRNAIISLLLFLFFKIMGSFFLLSSS